MDDSENYEILKMQDEETQIIQNDYIEKANIDIQVSTAKKYPRDPRRSVDNSIVMVTMNKETAESCGYALSRGGKIILRVVIKVLTSVNLHIGCYSG